MYSQKDILNLLYVTGCLFLIQPCNSVAGENPAFSLPLNCTEETVCFLQNLTDMDTGPQRQDPFCGTATYNGHKGTDIRVKNLAVMEQGIPVLAMADGTVLRLRNTMADRLIKDQAGFDAVKGKECGNGIVIDHGMFGGHRWTSQTCHLARNSIVPKPGQKIRRGDRIGLIGLSGSTQFPHVHVSIRQEGRLTDLLTGHEPGKRKTICPGQISENLLTPLAARQLKSMRTPLLDAGFAAGTVTNSKLIREKPRPPGPGTPLVFYASFINLKKSDSIRLKITANGTVIASTQTKPLNRPKATWTVFTGRQNGSKKGVRYEGEAKLIRNGRVVFVSPPTVFSF